MSVLQNHSQEAKPREWGPRGTAAATFAARMSFRHVSLAYGGLEAVSDVSFELRPGEIVCLLGPSGCGKTTLLRIAAGVERPQSGEVLLDGQVVASADVFVPPEKRNVGLMFQDYALFPHLSIIENVAFGLQNMARSEVMDEARIALKRVGLQDYEASYPHGLSGGEQQRVALARALVPRPGVMLMDEPFSGLDQRLRDSVRHETLILLKETRASSMLVTHDPVEAMGMADRILLMRRGRLVQAGTPDELYRHPVDPEAARFFCDFNEIPGKVEKGTVSTPMGDFPAGGIADGSDVVVMIRPQGIRRARSGDKTSREGQVLDARFLGDYHELTIQFHGLDQSILSRMPLGEPVSQGDVLAFTIDSEHVLVFDSNVA
ncbi:MAG: ABC transporter ATP-binding protein [Rhizobiales bacterium]|nr:ABC transporter ATP-binding protein [Hyphomicrobiales bacterium]